MLSICEALHMWIFTFWPCRSTGRAGVKVNCATIAKLLFSQGGFALAPWPHATFPRATRAFLKYQRKVRRVDLFPRGQQQMCMHITESHDYIDVFSHVKRKYNIYFLAWSIDLQLLSHLPYASLSALLGTGLCVCISNCRIIMLSMLYYYLHISMQR